jgi:hypothetical protein
MQSRNLKIALAVLTLVALPVVAFGQTSRLEGMQLQGDYVKDYTNIYAYPSCLTSVGNLVYGEFGNTYAPIYTANDRAVGAVLGNLWDGRFGTWAFHMRETTPHLGAGDQTSVDAVDPNSNSAESFDLMWAKKFGTASFGLRLNRSFNEIETSTSTVKTTMAFGPHGAPNFFSRNFNRNLTGIGAGLGFEMNPTTNAELSILYQSRTYEQTTSPIAGTNEAEDQPTSFMLSARAMWQWQSNVSVTPVVKWYSFDLSNKLISATQTQTFDNTLKGWQLGLAGNWTLGTNDLFVLGAAVTQNKVEQDTTMFDLTGIYSGDYKELTESMTPLMFAALETHVNPWLTIRFGAEKGVFSTIEAVPSDPVDNRVKFTTSTFEMMLGCGVKLGTLQFDAVVDRDFYHNLGWVGSGNAKTGGYFPKVTATYAF